MTNPIKQSGTQHKLLSNIERKEFVKLVFALVILKSIEQTARHTTIRRAFKLDPSVDVTQLEKVSAVLCIALVLEFKRREENKEGIEHHRLLRELCATCAFDPSYDSLLIDHAYTIRLLDLFTDFNRKYPVSSHIKQLFFVVLNRLLIPHQSEKNGRALDIFLEELKKEGHQDLGRFQKEFLKLKKFIGTTTQEDKTTFTVSDLRMECNSIHTEKSLQASLLVLISQMGIFCKMVNSELAKCLETILQLDENAFSHLNKGSKLLPYFAGWRQKAKSFQTIYAIRHRVAISSLAEMESIILKNRFLSVREIEYYDNQINKNLILLNAAIGAYKQETISVSQFFAESMPLKKSDAMDKEIKGSFPEIYCSNLEVRQCVSDLLIGSEEAMAELEKMKLAQNRDIREEELRRKSHEERYLLLQKEIKESLNKKGRSEKQLREALGIGEEYCKNFKRLLLSLENCLMGMQASVVYIYKIIDLNRAFVEIQVEKSESIDTSCIFKEKHTPKIKELAKVKKKGRIQKKRASSKPEKKKEYEVKPKEREVSLNTKAPIQKKKEPSVQRPNLTQPLADVHACLTSFSVATRVTPSIICFRNAAYHLDVFRATLEFLIQKPEAQNFLTFRLIRNASLFIEQTITGVLMEQNPTEAFTHDAYAMLSALQKGEPLSQPVQKVVLSLNYGPVYHRYPKMTEDSLQQSPFPTPEGLLYLLGTKRLTPSDLVVLYRMFLELSERLLSEKGLHAFTQKEAILAAVAKILEAQGVSKRETPHPYTAHLKSVLINSSKVSRTLISSSEMILHSKTQSESIKLKFQDVLFHLNELRQDLMLWDSYPDLSFFPSHLDSILTHLQFLEELVEEALHTHLFGTELRTHDFRYFRSLRSCEESEESENDLFALNIHKWAQYPHAGVQTIRQYNAKKLQGRSPLDIPLGITYRLNALEFAKNAEALESGFTPVQKGGRGKTTPEDPLKLQRDVAELTLRFLLLVQESLTKFDQIPSDQ